MTIEELAVQSHANAVDKGFWEDMDVHNHDTIATKLMLIVSECSEALEALRDEGTDGDINNSSGKPEGFPAELADIMIRVADLAEACDINLEYWVGAKMAYNKGRPYKHGRNF